MSRIHPTAIVAPEAQLADDVDVGPYAIIDGPVRIGAGSVVLAQTHVQGRTTVGRNCRLGPNAFVGLPAQDLKADPDAGSLWIGDDVVVRETATVHRSTHDDLATRVGDGSFLMGGSHVAHDCDLADHVILAQGVLLGGHVAVASRAFLGGGSVIHQFVRVGRLAILSGNEAVSQDVPPFAAARYGGLKGYNAVGCRRAGMSPASLHAVRSAFEHLHKHRLMAAAVDEIRRAGLADVPEVAELLAFLGSTRRGIVPSLRGRRHTGSIDDGDSRTIPVMPGERRGQPSVGVPTNGHARDKHACG